MFHVQERQLSLSSLFKKNLSIMLLGIFLISSYNRNFSMMYLVIICTTYVVCWGLYSFYEAVHLSICQHSIHLFIY